MAPSLLGMRSQFLRDAPERQRFGAPDPGALSALFGAGGGRMPPAHSRENEMLDLDRTLGHTRMEAESMFEFASENEAFQNGQSAEGFVFEAVQGETFDESEVNEFVAEL